MDDLYNNLITGFVGIGGIILGSFLTYRFTNKSNLFSKRLDWLEVPAQKFLEYSMEYSQAASHILLCAHQFYAQSKREIDNKDNPDFYKPAKEWNKMLVDDLNKITYLNLEVIRLAKPASNNFENFQKSEEKLFSTLAALIEEMRTNGKAKDISIDPIKAAQREFDEKSKEIHEELCGLNKFKLLRNKNVPSLRAAK